MSAAIEEYRRIRVQKTFRFIKSLVMLRIEQLQ